MAMVTALNEPTSRKRAIKSGGMRMVSREMRKEARLNFMGQGGICFEQSVTMFKSLPVNLYIAWI